MRRDWPENTTNFIPWTLDLTTLNAVAVPPSTAGAEGEYPAAIDVRRCRGYSLQIVPGTVTGGSCQVELRWSIDGKNFISLGSAYQLAVPAGAPSASSGYIISAPFYPFVQLATLAVASTGTANVFFAFRD